ncbi:aminotransferase class IV, partial [Psychrobacter sp. 1U2]
AKANYSDDFLLSGQWFTPPLTQSGVAGVMRQVIIDAFAKTKTPVIMRALNDDDLPNLRGLFFCNALRGVMPIDGLRLLGGEVVKLSSTLPNK